MTIKSEMLGLCSWKFWNFLFPMRLSNGESSRILKFLAWHGFNEIHQIHVKFGWNDHKQKIVVTKGTSKNSWILPLPHCSLTKTISHTFGSALTAHHYLLYKETHYYKLCYYTHQCTRCLLTNMKAYFRTATKQLYQGKTCFNQSQMQITSLNNQIIHDSHSLWFIFWFA